MKFFLSAFILAWLTGCVAALSVDRLNSTPIDAENREIVLLNNVKHEPEILKALAKKGFQVKAQISAGAIMEKENETRMRSYNRASARYGLKLIPGEQVGICLLNSRIVEYDNYTWELIDFKTNEPVLFISKGGWTGDCFPGKGALFEELTAVLAQEWR